ncbi:hypothetical protein PENSPDRAFT_693133 [Peniophora sp. CONT]|nr:hypothetical protein PENSPDRAFT_693133 [Peniophora sp. CONT]
MFPPLRILSRPALAAFLCTLCATVIAEDYTVPSGWHNTVSNATRSERMNSAWHAADDVQNRINSSLGIPMDGNDEAGSRIALVFAYQDYYSGNVFRKNQVIDNTLRLYEAGISALDDESLTYSIVVYGLAEVAAYLAYHDTGRLELARRNFDTAYVDFITPSAAQSGEYPRAPLTSNTTCRSTLGGLLFHEHGANSTNLAVLTTTIGIWVTLSARLAESTPGNTTYLTTAEQSIQFMQTHIINPSSASALVSDQFDVYHCTAFSDATPWAKDIGPYIEGLSIVANITQNQNYIQMLNMLVPLVVVVPEWHDSSGVLIEDSTYSKGTMIRGLLEARLRNPSNTDMVRLIDSYITLQYNAVVSNALIGDTNDYKVSWLGHGPANYSTVGNVDALDVLNAAFVITPTNSSQSNTTNPTEPASATNPVHKHAPIGAIVGGVVGSISVIAALVLLGFLYLRSRRRARELPVLDDRLEPFITDTSPRTRRTVPAEKGGLQQRVALLHQSHDSSPPTSPSSPALDAARRTSTAQARPSVGDSGALHAIERRLDNLMHALAVHGEAEDDPPVYDGDADHALNRNNDGHV